MSKLSGMNRTKSIRITRAFAPDFQPEGCPTVEANQPAVIDTPCCSEYRRDCLLESLLLFCYWCFSFAKGE